MRTLCQKMSADKELDEGGIGLEALIVRVRNHARVKVQARASKVKIVGIAFDAERVHHAIESEVAALVGQHRDRVRVAKAQILNDRGMAAWLAVNSHLLQLTTKFVDVDSSAAAYHGLNPQGYMLRALQDMRRRGISAWRAYANAERRCAWHLLCRGFLFRREPRFVIGKRPDFLTFGRGRMWVEVKALDPPMSQQLLDSAWKDLKKRLARFEGQYWIEGWVSPSFDSSVAKQAVKLLAGEPVNGVAAGSDLYVGIPAADAEKVRVQLEWLARGGASARMIAARSRAGLYGCPPSVEPDDWTADVLLTEGASRTRIPAFKILSAQTPCRLALRVTPRTQGRGLASLAHAEAQDVTTVERLRRVIDDAADQLKNAQTYRHVPGVVVVYFDSLGGGDQLDVLGACLGDVTIPIDAATRAPGAAFFGKNGMLRAGRNTGVSAVTYRSRIHPTVSLINPWARFPVPAPWLGGIVYTKEGDHLVRQ